MENNLKEHIQNILNEYPPKLRVYILGGELEEDLKKELSSNTQEERDFIKSLLLEILLGISEDEEIKNTIETRFEESKRNNIFEAINIILDKAVEQIPDSETPKKIPVAKPVDTEIMEHFVKPKEEEVRGKEQFSFKAIRVENMGNTKQVANPFSDQQNNVPAPTEERVTLEKDMTPLIKPVILPRGAVVPSFEESARAEATEARHVEQNNSPAIDSANRSSTDTYKGRDPYREPIE